MKTYLVIPYRHVQGAALPGNAQQALKLETAQTMLASLAERFPAVALYDVTVDEATGVMSDPVLVSSHGVVPDASAHALFSPH